MDTNGQEFTAAVPSRCGSGRSLNRLRCKVEQCVRCGEAHCGIFVGQRNSQSWDCHGRLGRKFFQSLSRSAAEVWFRLGKGVCKHGERRGCVLRLSEEHERVKSCVGNICVLILRQWNKCRPHSRPGFGIAYKNSLEGINRFQACGMAEPKCSFLQRLQCLRPQIAQCGGGLAGCRRGVCAIQNLNKARDGWCGCVLKCSEASDCQTDVEACGVSKSPSENAGPAERPWKLYYRFFKFFPQRAGLKSDPISEKGKGVRADLAYSCFGLCVPCPIWQDAVVEVVGNLKPGGQPPAVEGGFGRLCVLQKQGPYANHADAKSTEEDRSRSHGGTVT